MDFQDSFCIYETAYCERNPEHIKMHSVHIQCANIDNGILSETRMWTFKVFLICLIAISSSLRLRWYVFLIVHVQISSTKTNNILNLSGKNCIKYDLIYDGWPIMNEVYIYCSDPITFLFSVFAMLYLFFIFSFWKKHAIVSV